MNISYLNNFSNQTFFNDTPPRQVPPNRLVYSVFFGIEFLIGVVLNALTIAVCLRKSLRKTPSFIISGFIGLSSIILLAMTALPTFLDQITPYSFKANLIWCKLSLFFQIFSYNWAGWLLVTIVIKFLFSYNQIRISKKNLVHIFRINKNLIKIKTFFNQKGLFFSRDLHSNQH